ncbi:hypothetical protein LOK49_LG02G00740 [Camellia lanceoleosa]|uniref:Uncharacterized protein n=1 Tax=Camellia lanceoleosa TaxID=1840588 RepID=A0ACC0IMS9_9ERIC|nr:hypothetical protein LOK49_LG02G00740 [Camellia lanceoleosa]
MIERDCLDLRGLLSPYIMSLEQQIKCFMEDLKRFELNARNGPSDPNASAMWRILNRLHDGNETMYYKGKRADVGVHVVALRSAECGVQGKGCTPYKCRADVGVHIALRFAECDVQGKGCTPYKCRSDVVVQGKGCVFAADIAYLKVKLLLI